MLIFADEHGSLNASSTLRDLLVMNSVERPPDIDVDRYF